MAVLTTNSCTPVEDADASVDDECDSGHRTGSRRERERRCIVRQERFSEDDLIRFVIGPENVPVPDLKRRLPGHGAWVCATRKDVAEAVRKRAFSRAFKQDFSGQTESMAELPDLVERQLREAALGGLGLARKAGLAVIGFSKVDHAVRGGNASIAITASDGAADGRRKLEQAVYAAGSKITVEDGFSAQELSQCLTGGLAQGGANVIHAALLRDTRADGALRALIRFRRFRNDVIASNDGDQSQTP